MSNISTHILDISKGRPAAGVEIILEQQQHERWAKIGRGMTDSDGRCKDLSSLPIHSGNYRLTFKTEPYFAQEGQKTLYPEVVISFRIEDPGERYHIPLLLSPFGYSTYRGS